MTKSLISIRLETPELRGLRALSQNKGVSVASLIRSRIDCLLSPCGDPGTRLRVERLINTLREPFAYVKNPTGQAFARSERKARAEIIKRLKEDFGIT